MFFTMHLQQAATLLQKGDWNYMMLKANWKYTDIIANNLSAVWEQIHQLGHPHGAGQDNVLDVLAAIGQQGGQ